MNTQKSQTKPPPVADGTPKVKLRKRPTKKKDEAQDVNCGNKSRMVDLILDRIGGGKTKTRFPVEHDDEEARPRYKKEHHDCIPDRTPNDIVKG